LPDFVLYSLEMLLLKRRLLLSPILSALLYFLCSPQLKQKPKGGLKHMIMQLILLIRWLLCLMADAQ